MRGNFKQLLNYKAEGDQDTSHSVKQIRHFTCPKIQNYAMWIPNSRVFLQNAVIKFPLTLQVYSLFNCFDQQSLHRNQALENAFEAINSVINHYPKLTLQIQLTMLKANHKCSKALNMLDKLKEILPEIRF